MNETVVTVVGNVATQPDFREAVNGSAVSRFRLAATVRRWDRGKEEWADAYTSFYTVWAWRALAENVVASVTIGEPVIVRGKLRIQESEGREGGDGRRLSADIDAASIGHDLARGTSAFRRVSPARPLPIEPVRMVGAAPERPPERRPGRTPGRAPEPVPEPMSKPGSERAPEPVVEPA
ncbi:single-stranded DNA-binding protein [Streptomyces eurocidicus]|uniref:Single-strand DNA-binding protein n=1 Tax=Streptomyces eurocidicus TaxID=66423 RepID=A0A2N8P3W1_STREU|nr:single-stranded DNA-binding protein [Streptomyces eurocidicus]MBB5117560.1 single-strand DNA-binding protein [Streptomyces eurocidicus]MBF6053401.1 single-stranded DNA-binding protein [Streptomyces eurocidicus]PNE35715.1 single-stranded DNA-binding protein [Streptomyces eurocidicus]